MNAAIRVALLSGALLLPAAAVAQEAAPDPVLLAAQQALDQQQVTEALAILRRACEERPEALDLHRVLGDLALRADDPRQAAWAWRRVTQAAPSDGNAYWSLGLALHGDRRHAESLAALERAATLLPETAGVHQARGLALIEMQRYDAAASAFDRAAELAPEVAEYHYLSGYARTFLEQRPEVTAPARKALESALALEPAHLYANYHLGRMLLEHGQPAAALPHLELVVAAAPALAGARQALGYALLRTGREAEGRAELDRFRELELAQRDLERLGRLLRLTPANVELLAERSRLYLDLGMLGAAETDLAAALERAPDRPDLWKLLAELRQRAGDSEGGREALRRAAELGAQDGGEAAGDGG